MNPFTLALGYVCGVSLGVMVGLEVAINMQKTGEPLTTPIQGLRRMLRWERRP